jgi:hypothetical protein
MEVLIRHGRLGIRLLLRQFVSFIAVLTLIGIGGSRRCSTS